MEVATVMDEALEAPLRAKLAELEGVEEAEEAKVEEAKARAAEIIEEADKRRRTVAEERKRIAKALKVLRGEPLSAPKPKPTRASSTQWNLRDETYKKVREAAIRVAEASPDNGFFFFELNAESPHSDLTNRHGMEMMREAHEVRPAGKRDAADRGSRGSQEYWLLDIIPEEEVEEADVDADAEIEEARV